MICGSVVSFFLFFISSIEIRSDKVSRKIELTDYQSEINKFLKISGRNSGVCYVKCFNLKMFDTNNKLCVCICGGFLFCFDKETVVYAFIQTLANRIVQQTEHILCIQQSKAIVFANVCGTLRNLKKKIAFDLINWLKPFKLD